MQVRRIEWFVGGLAAVAALGIGFDLVHSHLRPPRDTRPTDRREADAMMAQLMRETGGLSSRLTPDQWRMMDEWRRKGTVTIATPGQAAANHALDENMRRLMVRCRGDYRRLTRAERALILPYVKKGYPMPRIDSSQR